MHPWQRGQAADASRRARSGGRAFGYGAAAEGRLPEVGLPEGRGQEGRLPGAEGRGQEGRGQEGRGQEGGLVGGADVGAGRNDLVDPVQDVVAERNGARPGARPSTASWLWPGLGAQRTQRRRGPGLGSKRPQDDGSAAKARTTAAVCADGFLGRITR